jgi:hypothetical protein
MCCFSQPVDLVENTNIFARSADDQQLLVYSMSYAARTDLAMVLPLPVPSNPSEDAVSFINLQNYTTFFDDMRRGFPPPTFYSSILPLQSTSQRAPKLRVHDVGHFEASFVPRIADFNRLEERFRIPSDAWNRFPSYHDYGFAVFKLKASGSPWLTGALRKLLRGNGPRDTQTLRRVHPMAFRFPRRNSDLLFFPTVHVHDRDVHPDATFDHMLYCQASGVEDWLQGWERSDEPASGFMVTTLTEGIVNPDHYCWRRPLEGRLNNEDTSVGKGGSIPIVFKNAW